MNLSYAELTSRKKCKNAQLAPACGGPPQAQGYILYIVFLGLRGARSVLSNPKKIKGVGRRLGAGLRNLEKQRKNENFVDVDDVDVRGGGSVSMCRDTQTPCHYYQKLSASV